MCHTTDFRHQTWDYWLQTTDSSTLNTREVYRYHLISITYTPTQRSQHLHLSSSSPRCPAPASHWLTCCRSPRSVPVGPAARPPTWGSVTGHTLPSALGLYLQVSRSLLYRQTTLESPCYQPSPHHRHPYQAVSPPSSPSIRAVTFSVVRPQEIVPRVEILEISPSPSLTSDCSAHTPWTTSQSWTLITSSSSSSSSNYTNKLVS